MRAASPFARLTAETFVFEGLTAGCYAGGSGPPLLLLHGSGPGASSVGNWRGVLDELAADHRVIALDLIGFGTSDRRAAPPYFDFALWVRQARAAIDRFDAPRVGVIGHSLSGAIALRVAAEDARVTRVMTTGTMGSAMPVNAHLAKVWRCPASREDMRDAARTLIHDAALIDDAYLDARMAVIGSPAYRAYFDAMFDRDFAAVIEAARVPAATLAGIDARVLMVHGRDDLPFPAEHTTLALLPDLPGADALLLSRCGHSVAMERPAAFLAAARLHFG